MTLSHGVLCEKIGEFLKTIPGLWYFRPVQMGYGRKGIPDFVICDNGNFLAFEVKVGKDVLSPWQRRERDGILEAKGGCFEIRSMRQVEDAYRGRARVP